MLGAVHADRTPALTGPYTERDPFNDPFVMFAYLAAITERISFTTGILVLPQRPTALLARPAHLFEGLTQHATDRLCPICGQVPVSFAVGNRVLTTGAVARG